MTAPVDPTVLDLLRGSALAPMLDQPVGQILSNLGLPQLPNVPPAPPLPDMPPLPVIDLAALAKPLTDMAAAFGTGQFPGGSAPAAAPAPGEPKPTGAPGAPQNAPPPPPADPTQMLQAVTTGMQSVMQLGMSALQAAMALWQGMAAQQAAAKQAEAQQNAGQLAGQSTEQHGILTSAAGSVATGGALMTAVIGKYTTTVAMTAPFLGTPPGQGFLLASTIESILEALGIVAKTRGEMTIHSANMTKAGTKVKITKPPTGVNAAQNLQQLMQLIQPLATMAQSGVQSASQLAAANKSLLAPQPVDAAERDRTAVASKLSGAARGGGGGGGGGIGGGVGGAVGAAPAPLSPWAGTRVAGGVGSLPGATGLGAGSVGGGSVAASPAPMASTAGAGMMPLGAAGAAAAGARATGDNDADQHADFLVTGRNGDEVVGPIEGVSVPVVGVGGQTPEPPPDKELTL
ncbi:hypothetical protein NDR87_19645 [Nocardia sp. CDC159]|uniref:Uncharacterized protein n=1 Tax=Nocardia pulmonis TaxID=2951408 RepID=A0A9X2IXJ6_9NOCA|nr:MULTISPECIES: hypothetical protein [Nocardia]MCM6776092.1 hypothetical protein [Nocardia pulmonis]MCM6788581.1 hypothetical protein [Nocardia sp. CDC159]